MGLLKETIDDMNVNGRRYVVTMGGDSTMKRGFGDSGELIAFFNALARYVPCCGGLAGMNYTGSGNNFLGNVMRRVSGTAVGVTTAPPTACQGGVVLPSGWNGYQHALLATSADTVATTAWCWTAFANVINSAGRVVVSMFGKDVAGASGANTGFRPEISTGNAISQAVTFNETNRQAPGTFATSARTIDEITAHATTPVVRTTTPHGFTTGHTVVHAGTNSTPAVNGSFVITVVDATHYSISAMTTIAGTAGFTNNSNFEGTLRRIDMESEQVAATGGADVGLTFSIGGAALMLGGPFLAMYVALTAKSTPKGWYASQHISLAGRSLHTYIRDQINTANMANSVETYFKCMLMLNDPTYANSLGGCQGDATPGGLGGVDLPVGCVWVDPFGHNDVGSDANTSSFVPLDGPAWAVEASGTCTAVNTGAGTMDFASTANFDASGHVHIVGGAVGSNEIITYTGKTATQLTGCVFAAYGSSAGVRVGATAVQGYLGITGTGHASNHVFWDQWLRLRWANAGGVDANFKHFWKVPNPSSDQLEVVSGVATANLNQREQRHREMVAAVKAHIPSPYFEVLDPRDVCTAGDMVRNRWCDSLASNVTVGASGVTSTAGDTINLNAGLSTNGVMNIGAETVIWTNKSGNNPTGCIRGAYGTTAYDLNTPSHTSGREVAEHDMIHSSTHGYQEVWRLLFNAAVPTSISAALDRRIR